MKYHDPLKTILSQGRQYWDRDQMRAAARRDFDKAMRCRTAELGAEVYSSENRELTSTTPANREPARVVATAPMYSGYASGGPPCQMHSIRGLRSQCRICSGPFSATARY